MDDKCLQEDSWRKCQWQTEMEKKFPIGCRVRVTGSDLLKYIGATAVVQTYDLGQDGDYPLISVKFDTPFPPDPEHSASPANGDGFYDDELERI